MATEKATPKVQYNGTLKRAERSDDETWEEHFKALLQRAKAHNSDPNCPQRCESSGLKIGKWLDKQRKQKKKGALAEERANRLEKAGVAWDARQHKADKAWDVRFAALQLLTDPNCPKDYVTPGDGTEGSAIKLGVWLHAQRAQKKMGTLAEERANRLEQAGVEWELRPTKRPRVEATAETAAVAETLRHTHKLEAREATLLATHMGAGDRQAVADGRGPGGKWAAVPPQSVESCRSVCANFDGHVPAEISPHVCFRAVGAGGGAVRTGTAIRTALVLTLESLAPDSPALLDTHLVQAFELAFQALFDPGWKFGGACPSVRAPVTGVAQRRGTSDDHYAELPLGGTKAWADIARKLTLLLGMRVMPEHGHALTLAPQHTEPPALNAAGAKASRMALHGDQSMASRLVLSYCDAGIRAGLDFCDPAGDAHRIVLADDTGAAGGAACLMQTVHSLYTGPGWFHRSWACAPGTGE